MDSDVSEPTDLTCPITAPIPHTPRIFRPVYPGAPLPVVASQMVIPYGFLGRVMDIGATRPSTLDGTRWGYATIGSIRSCILGGFLPNVRTFHCINTIDRRHSGRMEFGDPIAEDITPAVIARPGVPKERRERG